MRNFTPSPARLSPYNRSSLHLARKHKKEESSEAPVEDETQDPTTEVVPQTSGKSVFDNESVEDVNMGDLGFLDDIEKEGKAENEKPKAAPTTQKPRQRISMAPAPTVNKPMRPIPPSDVLERDTKPRIQINPGSSKFAKVIDGAALLRVSDFKIL